MEVDPAPVPQPHLGPMQYQGALGNDLWRVAVFPGADGWTVVKTAPLELLGERRAGADTIRLAEGALLPLAGGEPGGALRLRPPGGGEQV